MLSPRPLPSLRNSLPAKLALLVMLFIVAVIGVRVSSLDHLLQLGSTSSEVRNRWLDSIRYLDHINEHVSDLRAAESDILLSRDPARRESRLTELPKLLDEAGQAIERYKALAHDPDETLIFDAFLRHWAEHADHVQALTALARNGQSDDAALLFDGAARATYETSESELRRLADLTETKAEAARDKTAKVIAGTQRWISDLIFGILVLFMGLAAYLWWSVSRPLIELAGLMRRLASHDTDFSSRFESRPDEIGEMARALSVFRLNTIELLESRKRLSSQAEILGRSLDKERALATEQRNFISTISHEFRTPLMAIDGNAQRLVTSSERAKPSEIVDRAQKIRAAVFRMTNLVGSLLNAVEFARGELRARTRPFDLGPMLRDLARYYGEIGIGRDLQANVGQLPLQITGDPELLYQAFSNLISNAFKYSPENGIVTLEAKVNNGVVAITVEDHGLGIPRDEIDRVREPYYRASNVGSISGTGMGLRLVDEIVRQHGGRVDIDSEEGKGTRVVVVLPPAGETGVPERVGEQDLVRRGRPGDGEPPGGGVDRARVHG